MCPRQAQCGPGQAPVGGAHHALLERRHVDEPSGFVERASCDGKTLWHMGWLSPDDTYVGLEQTDDGRDDLLDQLFVDTRPDGTSVIGDQRWERLREVGDDDADYALVRTDNGVTTVVLGRGGYPELEDFAKTLQTG